jgi:hypothetical protein
MPQETRLSRGLGRYSGREPPDGHNNCRLAKLIDIVRFNACQDAEPGNIYRVCYLQDRISGSFQSARQLQGLLLGLSPSGLRAVGLIDA